MVTREVEVPGPERIVEVPGPERRVEVPGPERIVERIVEVEVPGPERIVEVEKIVEVLVEPSQPQDDKKKPPPNSWTFTPKNADLPVDNADQNKNSKYYIKKP